MSDTPEIDPRAALTEALFARFGEHLAVPPDLEGLPALLQMATWSTHRSWSDQPVSADLIRLLAACALSAPSKSYLQQADIVQVRDATQRERVQALVPSMPWMSQAPALLVLCGNGRRFRRLFERAGQPFTNEHLDGLFNPAIDGALVMMNFMRAAAAVGMVCCPISVLRDEAHALADILQMPSHVFPIAGLCVGFPAQAQSVNPRLGLQASLHTDRYGQGQGADAAHEEADHTRIDAAVDEYDRRYVAVRASRLPPEVAAAKPPMSWSQEKLKQYAQAQREDWGDFLRAKGFDTR
jgi:nitroreductase/FMN reductase [NAD(P)H]